MIGTGKTQSEKIETENDSTAHSPGLFQLPARGAIKSSGFHFSEAANQRLLVE
jgi:hypothetical protein